MIGRTLSHYKILEKLGEGGMGVVYLAEDTKLGRRIALKLLPAEWTRSSKARVRFLHEAQTAAALNHPNLCTIHEVDEADGQVFIAMEHIEGESLRDRIAQGPMKIADVIATALEVGQGLAAAHAQGIVHRDIKPGNVMLTSDGRAKVLDFGLALVPERTRLTMEGRTTGTVSYMSPEQSRGDAVDHRTDIWSLGVMLYEMLTGQRPFAGEHEQAVLHSIMNDEPEPPTGLRTGVPLALERVVTKAMAKHPEERYQHIDDLLVDLQSVQKDSSTGSKTVTAAVQTGRAAAPAARRRPLATVLVICAVAVACVASYVAWNRGRQVATGPAQPERVMVATFDNRTGDPSLDHVGHTAATSISEGLVQTGVVEVVTHSVGRAAGGRVDRGSGVSELLAVASEAGASVLLAGSFRAQSDSLHIEVRLLGVSEGTVLNVIPDEAGPLANPSVAIAKTRSRVMGALAARADPTIGREARTHAPTYEAYQEYAAGMKLFGEQTTRALEHFERAAELDPAFSVARVWEMGTLHALGRYAESDSLIQNVLSQPGYVTPHAKLMVDAIAASYRSDFEGSLRKLREYVRLEPEHWWATRLLGLTALRLNRPQEAIEVCGALVRHGPETHAPVESWIYGGLATGYHMLGEFERELETARQAIEAFPDMLWIRSREVRALAALGRAEEIHRIIEECSRTPAGHGSVWGVMITATDELRAHGHPEEAAALAKEALEWQRNRVTVEGSAVESRRLARSLFCAGHWEEAHALYEELALADPDNIDNQGYLGVLAARMGNRERALHIKKALLARDVPYELGSDTYWAACIAAQLGEREEAMDLLRLAFTEGADIGLHVHQDPDFEPLWDYPPFQRFIEPRD